MSRHTPAASSIASISLRWYDLRSASARMIAASVSERFSEPVPPRGVDPSSLLTSASMSAGCPRRLIAANQGAQSPSLKHHPGAVYMQGVSSHHPSHLTHGARAVGSVLGGP